MTKPEEKSTINAIWELLEGEGNKRLNEIRSKLDPKKPGFLSIDEIFMLQTLAFNEYKKTAEKTSKTMIYWTRGLVMATGILALAATITVLCRL